MAQTVAHGGGVTPPHPPSLGSAAVLYVCSHSGNRGTPLSPANCLQKYRVAITNPPPPQSIPAAVPPVTSCLPYATNL